MFGESNIRNVEKLPLVDTRTPYSVQLTGFYKRSFAYFTIKERLPIIITKVIDHLSRDRDEIAKQYPNSEEDIKGVIGYLSKMKNEIQTNKRLSPLTVQSDDTEEWNALIEQVPDPFYFTCVWLFTECYVYRRMREAFQIHSSLIEFDAFRDVKDMSFNHSIAAICMAADAIPALVDSPDIPVKGSPPVSHLLDFQQVIRMNLWGNKCDLSLSVGAEVTQDSNPVTMVQKYISNIIVDHSEHIYQDLEIIKRDSVGKDVIIDIVCDNSGYELFTDFCLADFLISRHLATHIRFHCKLIPWFVSDATVRDVQWVIDSCVNASYSSEKPNPDGTKKILDSKNVRYLGQRWKNYVTAGTWSWKADHFWTTPHEYYKMKDIDKDLYNMLSQAAMVFFKGDLNYRKLMGEYNWPPTTPFETALREFFPCPLVAIRTVKADLISGLPEGVQEKLNAIDDKWMEKGDYGLIQYCPRKIVLAHEVVLPTEEQLPPLTKPPRAESKSPGRGKSKSPARGKSPGKK